MSSFLLRQQIKLRQINYRRLIVGALFLCSPPPPARWFPASSATASQSSRTEHKCSDQDVFDIRQFLLDQRRQKELAQGIGIEEDMMEDIGRKSLA